MSRMPMNAWACGFGGRAPADEPDAVASEADPEPADARNDDGAPPPAAGGATNDEVTALATFLKNDDAPCEVAVCAGAMAGCCA